MLINRAVAFCLLLLSGILAVSAANAAFLHEGLAEKQDIRGAQQAYEEVVIEQSLRVSAEKSRVFNRLADLNNYAYFYPLFSELTINPQNKTVGQASLLDFTATSLQRFGPVFVERQYYGMLAVDTGKATVALHLMDAEGVLIKLSMHIVQKDSYTQVSLKTAIKAPRQDLNDLLLDELRAPTLRLESLKDLLENEVVPSLGPCQYSPNNNRYCF